MKKKPPIGCLITSRSHDADLLVFDDMWKCADTISPGEIGIIAALNSPRGRCRDAYGYNNSYVQVISPRGAVGYILIEFAKKV